MNICLWSSCSFETPYASYHLMHSIINAMLRSHHNVWLIQMQYKNGEIPEDFINRKNLHIINIPMKSECKSRFIKRYMREILYYFKTLRLIKRIPNLDAIFLQSTNAAFVPVMFSKIKKIPILYNVQDVFPLDAVAVRKLSYNGILFKILRYLQSLAYRNSSMVVTISEDLSYSIRNEGGKNVSVIYNWSYRDEPYIIDDSENHFLRSQGINRSDGFRVVYAGNVGQMMDVDMFVNVAVSLKSFSDIILYVIGQGSNLEYLKKMINRYELNNVRIFPSQPMEFAPDNYCMADVNIILVPKGVIYTCMPSKINTALLCQKPTIVSIDLDSDMAIKLASVDKWCVISPGDSESMVQAILKYYNSSEWGNKSNNSSLFLNQLGSISNAEQYVHIIEEIVRT